MTEILKQRIVGLLLVVIAGVVFLPDILDGKKELTKEDFKKVPPRPEVSETPYLSDFPTEKVLAELESSSNEEEYESSPEEVGNVLAASKNSTVEANEGAAVTSQIVDEKEKLTEDSPDAEVESEFKSPAWVLQLGSFRQKENADALKQKIEQVGFITFIKPVQTKAGVLSKVFVGPELDKNTLLNAQQKLKTLTGLDGKVTPYNPVD